MSKLIRVGPRVPLRSKRAESASADRTVSISLAKAKLSELIDRVRIENEPIVIRRHKRHVAVLVPADRYRDLQEMEDAIKSERLRRELRKGTRPLRGVLAKLDLGI